MTRLMPEYSAQVPRGCYMLPVQFNRNGTVVVIERGDSVGILGGQVGPTERDIWQFCVETLTVDLLILLEEVQVVDGLMRVSVTGAEKNDNDGD